MTSLTAVGRTRARALRLGIYMGDLWHRREFAWFLAMGNLKARNASTALGLFWWVLNPLLLGMVYYVVFNFIFSSGRDIAYLLSGMFVFHFSAQSMTGGANSILQNSKLLSNLRFPRLVLPIANLIESTVGFMASLLVLYAIAVPSGSVHSLRYLPLLLIVLPIHVLFNLGLSSFTARLSVPFRDINNITPYVTRLWLYLSPVIWPLSFVEGLSPTGQFMFQLNPLYWIIAAYRSAFFGVDFQLAAIGWSALSAAIIGTIGIGLFIKYENKIVRHL